jgi:hypothetical protein
MASAALSRCGLDPAVLSHGDLRLLLNRPSAGGVGQPTPDGRRPQPGAGIEDPSGNPIELF